MNITFLMAYRHRYETERSLLDMLVSFRQYYPDEELLIRLDSDDLKGKSKINELKDKFNIRTFIYNRWEGRYTIYLDYQYLFTKRNLNTKWTGFITDDIIFTRCILDELDNKYQIIGDFKKEMTVEKLNKDFDYSSEYICAYPIVSARLLEIIGNMGYQLNIDSTLALLNYILYKETNIIIAKHIKEFIIRNNIDRTEDYGHNITKEWRVSDSEHPNKDSYFWKLMRQTAKNIYLNLKYDKQ